jgi:hypothetical protein
MRGWPYARPLARQSGSPFIQPPHPSLRLAPLTFIRIHTRYDRCVHTYFFAIGIAVAVIFWL